MSKFLTCISIMFLLKSITANAQQANGASSTIGYKKSDLIKIKWIEGSWQGMYNNKPFYEHYDMINDSTLKITSFQLNGTDTSNSTYDYVQWKNDAYYLGKQQNWKVTSITKDEIKMIPVKASNDITWKYKDKKNWQAILTSNKGVTEYQMQHFDLVKK